MGMGSSVFAFSFADIALRRSDTQNVKRSEQGHTLGRALPTKLDPGRRVIAGVVFASNIAIHAVYRNDSAAS
jgi:hypothetical protein